jgi:hypothetical protein
LKKKLKNFDKSTTKEVKEKNMRIFGIHRILGEKNKDVWLDKNNSILLKHNQPQIYSGNQADVLIVTSLDKSEKTQHYEI